MLQPPGLDYDIWREVLKTCSRPDCARLMRTCRFFYTYGFAALLSHPISLETEEDLVRFLRPFQTYADERCRLVRSLDLLFPDLAESIAPQLAHALRRMSSLKTLLVSYSEDIISSHPGLLDAFADLPSLHKLDLRYAGVRAVEMLRSLRSKLVVVHIGFRTDDDSDDDTSFDPIPEDNLKVCYPGPAVFLASSRTSLQELSSSSWATDAQTLPDAMLVYPHMYRLSVVSPVFPRTMAFIRTYPNLTHFTFSLDFLRQPLSFHPSNLGPWEAWHARNVSEQVTSSHTWAAMHELTGSVPDLYMLGLTCLVESLHVDTVREPLLYMLERVLSHTRPRHLTLDDWPEFFSYRAAPDIFAVLRGRGSERLITLRIDTVLHEEDEDVDVAAVFEGLRSTLVGTPIQNLQLEIGMGQVDPRPWETRKWGYDRRMEREARGLATAQGEPDYPWYFAELSADAFDLGDYMRRFMEEVPTLREANVILTGPRDRQRKATIVDGQLSIQELDVRHVIWCRITGQDPWADVSVHTIS